MKYLLITTVAALIIYLAYRTYQFAKLADGLDTKFHNGAIILDVRTTREFAGGHIRGSVNISLGDLRQRYIELDSSMTYITVCSHGLRSVKAESILKERGFKNVFNGGAWSDLEKKLSSR